MTKKETVQLLAILKAAYPNSYNGMTKDELAGTVTVWMMQFADMPADIVVLALQKHISVSKFPPTVAEIKSKITSIHWEAYEKISGIQAKDRIPAEDYARYERIYEVTKGYRSNQALELNLSHLLIGSQPLQLDSGKERQRGVIST